MNGGEGSWLGDQGGVEGGEAEVRMHSLREECISNLKMKKLFLFHVK